MRVMTEVIDSRAFSEFCGVTSPDEVPDGDTIGRFRNLLEKNGIQEKIFAEVVKILERCFTFVYMKTLLKIILKKGLYIPI
jgi:IS5 family transposase